MSDCQNILFCKKNRDPPVWEPVWPPVWETAIHLAVACGVFYGVFCAVLFPAGCLGWDLGLN